MIQKFSYVCVRRTINFRCFGYTLYFYTSYDMISNHTYVYDKIPHIDEYQIKRIQTIRISLNT